MQHETRMEILKDDGEGKNSQNHLPASPQLTVIVWLAVPRSKSLCSVGDLVLCLKLLYRQRINSAEGCSSALKLRFGNLEQSQAAEHQLQLSIARSIAKIQWKAPELDGASTRTLACLKDGSAG